MRLTTGFVKWFTALMLLLCLLLVAGWPFIMGPRPGPEAVIVLKKEYAVRFVTMISTIVLILIFAAVGAIVVLRRTLAELREAQMSNMRDLVETTLEAHKQRSSGDATQS